MREMLVLSMPALILGCAGSCSAARPGYLDLSFANRDAWTVTANAPWWGLIDNRDMLNLFHPLVESETGATAGASRECVIPADWEGRFLLRFHCADDYFADPDNHRPGMPGTESFFEHRFKQALIDDQVVWERDVIDDNMPTSQKVFEVDITRFVTPGKPFTLTLRVLDRTSTRERNDRDVWFIGGTWFAGGDGKTEEPPRFHTAVWFGDPIIGEAEAVSSAPVGVRPNELRTAERHAQRWPLPPESEPLPSPARLSLVAPDTIPGPGFPITCGIPFSPGTLRKEDPVALTGPDGAPLPIQAEVTGWWPDGSVRWLLVSTIAPAGVASGAPFELSFGDGCEGAAPAQTVAVERQGSRVTLKTGVIAVALGGSRRVLLDSVRVAGNRRPALRDLKVRMSVELSSGVVPVVAAWDDIEVVRQGPVTACVEVHGALSADPGSGAKPVHIGRFIFRLYAYAGLPTLQTSFRIINDLRPEPYKGTSEDPPLRVTDLALVGTLPDRTDGAVAFGKPDGSVIASGGAVAALHQDRADHFNVTVGGTRIAEGQTAQGWIGASCPGGFVQAAMWRFWQQAPKLLAVDGDQLTIGLFAAAEAEPAYLPRYGEAKRHDIWLSFAAQMAEPSEMVALGKLADEPPRLFDADRFCLSGGIGYFDPQWLQNVPQLREWIARSYGDVSSASIGNSHWGLRNFGDFPYGPTTWRNGYYARIQGAINWGLASGDQRWIERAIEISRHIADVDTVHIQAGHPDWREWDGMTVALGDDHSNHNAGSARWSAFMAADQLICHYWLTGDRDSLAEAVAGAEFLVRLMPGVGSLGVREGTRPMLCLMRVWEATGDGRYLDAARKYCDLQFIKSNVMDWRRGTYICPLYSNWRIISAGQDSMYADVVYRLYRLTGDLDLAQIVVAIADSIYAEAMLPQEESLGDFIFYPRYGRNSWYFPQMAVLFCQAYDLTGDVAFLRAARAAQARYLLCSGDGGRTYGYQTADNFGYVDPDYAGWARALRDVSTAPFEPRGMVSDPDPTNFLPKQ